MNVLHYCLIDTSFHLDDVYMCCEINVGTRCKGREWFEGVYLEGSIRIPVFTDGTRHCQLVQALYHCHPGFFDQGAETKLTTRAEAQYHLTQRWTA